MSNIDLAFGAAILQNPTRDRRIQIWLSYGDAPADNEVTTVFVGSISGAPTINEKTVVLECTRFSEQYALMPRYRVGSPVFNHLPPPDMRIDVAGDVLYLQPKTYEWRR